MPFTNRGIARRKLRILERVQDRVAPPEFAAV